MQNLHKQARVPIVEQFTNLSVWTWHVDYVASGIQVPVRSHPHTALSVTLRPCKPWQ